LELFNIIFDTGKKLGSKRNKRKFAMSNQIIKGCHNCLRYKKCQDCIYNNVEKLVRLEKSEECPFWIPQPSQKETFKKLKNKKGLNKLLLRPP